MRDDKDHEGNCQLLEDGSPLLPALRAVIMVMARHGVDGLVERDDLPRDVLIGGRLDCLFHECSVLGSGEIVGIEHQDQHIVVNKVAVAAAAGSRDRDPVRFLLSSCEVQRLFGEHSQPGTRASAGLRIFCQFSEFVNKNNQRLTKICLALLYNQRYTAR